MSHSATNEAPRDAEPSEDTTIGVRMSPDLIARVDSYRSVLARTAPGVAFTRSDAVRALLTAGLNAIDPKP